MLVNTDAERTQALVLDRQAFGPDAALPWPDLLEQKPPEMKFSIDGKVTISFAAGAAFCLSPTPKPQGLAGDAYRGARAQAAWALESFAQLLPARALPLYPWRQLASLVEESPTKFLAGASLLATELARIEDYQSFRAEFSSLDTFAELVKGNKFSQVVLWSIVDRNRVTPVPPGHWLLIEDAVHFRASLKCHDNKPARHIESLPVGGSHIVAFPPRETGGDATLSLERYCRGRATRPSLDPISWATSFLLATNTARHGFRPSHQRPRRYGTYCIDPGRVCSKYDCVLGANLHPALPVDRHIFAKRIRVWVNAGGFIAPLDFVKSFVLYRRSTRNLAVCSQCGRRTNR